MILIDLMHIIIPNIMVGVQSNSNEEDELSEDVLRNMIFRSILGHIKRFKYDYGDEVILCLDDKNYWRKEIFPPYKHNRKKNRENSNVSWEDIYSYIDSLTKELKEVFPHKVLHCPRAEADDIISVICHEFGDYKNKEPKILIVSGDKDLSQLLKFANVEQYSPLKKQFIVINNPEAYLREHIIRGDYGDGIPNFLSDDNVFVDGIRQKSLSQLSVNEWIRLLPEEFCTNEQMKSGYDRNVSLIDLSKIPEDIKQSIISSYYSTKVQNKSKMRDYFSKHNMTDMFNSIKYF